MIDTKIFLVLAAIIAVGATGAILNTMSIQQAQACQDILNGGVNGCAGKYGEIETEVSLSGNGAHIFVPKTWYGKRVRVTLINEPKVRNK